MKTERSLSLVLSAFLLSASFVGCGGSAEPVSAEPESSLPAETEASSETVDFSQMTFIERLAYDRQQIADSLPERDFGGYGFRVGYLYQNGGDDAYSFDWIADGENGEILNDSVYARKRTVEERFNVQLSFVQHEASRYDSDVSKPILAGEDAYDMLSTHPGKYGKLLTDGMFLPLSDLPYLDFSKPWWVLDSVDAMSSGGVFYTAFGLATPVSVLGYSPVMYFNKQIAADHDLDNFYDIVREGRWTVDYLLGVIRQVSADIDGDGKFTESDRIGLHLPASAEEYCYVWLLGGSYVRKDNDGTPVLNIDDPTMERIFDKAKELFSQQGVVPEDGYSAEAFMNGNVLFESAHLATCGSDYRTVSFDFGILPNVKLDEEQEYYLVNIGGGPQAIPKTCTDTERTAILMEALNEEGYKQIVPAYFETVLKDKCARDEDSAEMLDLAYTHLTYDGAYVFCPDILYTLSAFCNGNKGYASYTESNAKGWNKTLTKTVEAFNGLDK